MLVDYIQIFLEMQYAALFVLFITLYFRVLKIFYSKLKNCQAPSLPYFML